MQKMTNFHCFLPENSFVKYVICMEIKQGLILNWYWVLSTEVLANFSGIGTGTGTVLRENLDGTSIK